MPISSSCIAFVVFVDSKKLLGHGKKWRDDAWGILHCVERRSHKMYMSSEKAKKWQHSYFLANVFAIYDFDIESISWVDYLWKIVLFWAFPLAAFLFLPIPEHHQRWRNALFVYATPGQEQAGFQVHVVIFLHHRFVLFLHWKSSLWCNTLKLWCREEENTRVQCMCISSRSCCSK